MPKDEDIIPTKVMNELVKKAREIASKEPLGDEYVILDALIEEWLDYHGR